MYFAFHCKSKIPIFARHLSADTQRQLETRFGIPNTLSVLFLSFSQQNISFLSLQKSEEVDVEDKEKDIEEEKESRPGQENRTEVEEQDEVEAYEIADASIVYPLVTVSHYDMLTKCGQRRRAL